VPPPLRIPAVCLRGGTSKGVFFVAADLPAASARRDRIPPRAVGSPDRGGREIAVRPARTVTTARLRDARAIRRGAA